MVRLLKGVGLAVPLLLIAVLLLARFSDSTRQHAAGVIVRAAQVLDFLKMAPAKDKHCSLADVWRHAVDLDKLAARTRWEQSFKIVKADRGLQLISTPHAEYWIPERHFGSLAEMLDDQERDIYGSHGCGVRAGDIVLD